MDFFELAACDMKNSDIFERCPKVTERPDDGVIEFEVLEARQNLAGDLQGVARCVDSELQFLQQGKLAHFDPAQGHRQELFIEVDNVLDLLIDHDLHELVLHIGDRH